MENQLEIIQDIPQLPKHYSQFDEHVFRSSNVTLIILCNFSFDIELLIALCKDKHTCTSHSLSDFIYYSHLYLHIVLLFLLWTHTQFPICQKPFLFQGRKKPRRRKWCSRVEWDMRCFFASRKATNYGDKRGFAYLKHYWCSVSRKGTLDLVILRYWGDKI